ncbi:MAG: MarP family serine protease [Gaiellales bacterium]
MNTLDLIIGIIVLTLACVGYAQGFIVGLASLFGLVLCGLVGTRVSRVLLERAAEDHAISAWAPMIGLGVGIVITLAGAMAMQDLGAELRRRLRTSETAAVDRLSGAVLLAMVGLLLAWFSAAATIGVPQLRPLRANIVGSQIILQLNQLLPDAQPIIGVLASYDPFPSFDGGAIEARAPDIALPKDPAVRASAEAVVRVVGTACGYQITGSGWVAAPGYVVTNAHVVGGQSDTGIQRRGDDAPIKADVVSFDSVNDVAVLRVPGLDIAPLRARSSTSGGTAAVVLGYPESLGFVASPARYSDERLVRGEDIYAGGDYQRRVDSFRGVVRHGNSGGPLVDGQGAVISTVFASTVGGKLRGGYGIPNDIVFKALKRGQSVPSDKVAVTGPCVS